jgi:hypothetical protein
MMGHEVSSRGGQGSAMGIAIDPDEGMVWGAADSRAFDGGAIGGWRAGGNGDGRRKASGG